MIQISKNYSYSCPIDFRAPILPGIGIGNLTVGTHLSKLKDWLTYSFFIKNVDDVKANLFNGLFLQYTIKDLLEFVVDPMNGTIIRISCTKDYIGSWENKIRPGSYLFDALSMKKGFYIENGTIISKEIKGLEIDLPEEFSEHDNIEEIPNFEIKRIIVVA